MIAPPPARVIRQAAMADAGHLAEMAAQAFRDTYRGIDAAQDIEDYVAAELTDAYFARHIRDPESSVLLACAAEVLHGYAIVTRSDPPACVNSASPVELARLYLRERAQGLGHGAALMQAALLEARRFGADAVWLGVYDRNTRAREFYRRWGFVDVGTKGFHFGGRVYADPVMCLTPLPSHAQR